MPSGGGGVRWMEGFDDGFNEEGLDEVKDMRQFLVVEVFPSAGLL